MHEPRSYYESEAIRWESALQHAVRRERLISRLRLLTALLGLAAVFLALEMEAQVYWLLPVLALLAFIFLVRSALRQEARTALTRARLLIAAQELQALDGNSGAFPSGAEYLDVTHPFSFDLDMFGPRSIYQMLCRSVSLEGRSLLARLLQQPLRDKDTIMSYQAAIRELSGTPELSCGFRARGLLSAENSGELQQLRHWLAAADYFRNRSMIRLASILMPVVSALGVAISLWQEQMHIVLSLAIALNGLLWGANLKRIKEQNRQLGRNAAIIAKYTALLEIQASGTFNAEILQEMALAARKSLAQLRIFNRLVSRFDSRNNGMAGPVMNVLFLHDFRSLIQLEAWRAQNRELLENALSHIATFDLLNGLGAYAFNHPDYNYPQVDAGGGAIIAVNLRHPLLPGTAAVGNTFSLGSEEQLYLLTGANMTGKSTFIRTVGVSLILGQLGLPLPADAATLPLLRLYTSIRVSDSIQEDVSYFRAELERIRALFGAVHEGRGSYMVLIDEPLRGTNSGDKQQGTQAIIRRLLREGAIGIVATHDTSLCELEDTSPGLKNFHFESRLVDGVLEFDFRLRPGPSTSANASLLMQQMGII